MKKSMIRIGALVLAALLLLTLAATAVTTAFASSIPANPEAGDIIIPITPVNPKPSQPDTGAADPDVDANGDVNTDDAVYLLLAVMFGEEYYPLVNAFPDFDNSGEVTTDDAVYLLLYIMFGEEYYPLPN